VWSSGSGGHGAIGSDHSPLVREAVDFLDPQAKQPVVVVEAIKLLEGELRNRCDSIWVTYAPPQARSKG